MSESATVAIIWPSGFNSAIPFSGILIFFYFTFLTSSIEFFWFIVITYFYRLSILRWLIINGPNVQTKLICNSRKGKKVLKQCESNVFECNAFMLPILFIYIILHFKFLTITFKTSNNIDSKYSKTKALFMKSFKSRIQDKNHLRSHQKKIRNHKKVTR